MALQTHLNVASTLKADGGFCCRERVNAFAVRQTAPPPRPVLAPRRTAAQSVSSSAGRSKNQPCVLPAASASPPCTAICVTAMIAPAPRPEPAIARTTCWPPVRDFSRCLTATKRASALICIRRRRSTRTQTAGHRRRRRREFQARHDG